MKVPLTLFLLLPSLLLAEPPSPPPDTNALVLPIGVVAVDPPDNPAVTTTNLIEQLGDQIRLLAARRADLKQEFFPQADRPVVGSRPLAGELPADVLKRLAPAQAERNGATATVGGQLANGGLLPDLNPDTLGLQNAVAQDPESKQYRAQIKHLQLWIAARQAAERKSRAATNAVAKAAAVEVALVKFQREQAEAGTASYQFTYGQRLMKGDGVEANEFLGRAYIGKAAAQGYEPAVKSLTANP